MTREVLTLLFYIITAIIGVWAGMKLSRAPRRFWLTVLGCGLCIFFLIILARHVPAICHPSLFFLGQSQFTEIMLCGVIPLLFGILVPQIPKQRLRILVFVFAAGSTLYFGFFTQLNFIATRNRTAAIKTWIENDVCLQTTNYTCGAAAAVSALKTFGIRADESALAVASRTTSITGTTEYMLARAIETLYANEKISCRIQGFNSVDQLHNQCPVIAIVKLRLGVDHFVTVLDINKDAVTIADPLSGKEILTPEAFAEKWRFAGILVYKKQASRI